jgi:hypothetical protein
MKRIKILAGIALVGLVAFNSPAPGLVPLGPVTFRISATQQALDFALISTKTNQTSTATNVTQTFKSTVTSSKIDNGILLSLLANSLRTNFVPDAQLFGTGVGFYVMDSAGTNVQMSVTGVLQMNLINEVASTVDVQTTGTQNSNNSRSTQTVDVELTYDDSALMPTDGTHTVFTLRGLLLLKLADSTTQEKGSFVFNCTGSGTLRNVTKIFKGTISGKGAVTFSN